MKRRFTFRVLVICGGLAVGLLLAEGFLRLIGFKYSLYLTSAQVGYPDAVSLVAHYEMDRQLLWVPKHYGDRIASWRGKPPAIAFMGCSCTEFDRYDSHFAKLVESHSHKPLEFLNVGVSGWSSYQGLQQLRRDVVPLRPKMVTIFYGWNDHWRSFGIEDKAMARYNLTHPTLVTLAAFGRIRVVQLVNFILISVQRRGGRERSPERVSAADFRDNLTQMITLARENGIVPVLLTAPTPHTKGQEPDFLAIRHLNELSDLIPLHQEYVQVVRTVAKEHQVPIVDLEHHFNEYPDEARFFTQDGIHLNEEGSREVARFMFKEFREQDLLRFIDSE